jgi:hypothetical protein
MAAILDKELLIGDVPSAFLIPERTPNDPILYTFVEGDLVSLLCSAHPEYQRHVINNRLYFYLNKYLYGTPYASRKFFDHMTLYFTRQLGFTQCESDKCMFTKFNSDNERIILVIHVDDILAVCDTPALKDWLRDRLIHDFNVTSNDGNNLDYIGINIVRTRSARRIKVSMKGLIDKCIEKFGKPDMKTFKTPAGNDIFEIDPESPLTDRDEFLSLIMTLIYPARFCRPDYILPISILATRSDKPTEYDMFFYFFYKITY